MIDLAWPFVSLVAISVSAWAFRLHCSSFLLSAAQDVQLRRLMHETEELRVVLHDLRGVTVDSERVKELEERMGKIELHQDLAS